MQGLSRDVKKIIDKGRADAATQSRGNGQDHFAWVGKLADNYFPFYLQPNHKEENSHQTIFYPMAKRKMILLTVKMNTQVKVA